MAQIAENPELLAEIDAHCAAAGITRSEFGMRALGDPSFVFDLEKGRDPRGRTIRRVKEFIATGIGWDARAATDDGDQ
jgi:hypothetical protein